MFFEVELVARGSYLRQLTRAIGHRVDVAVEQQRVASRRARATARRGHARHHVRYVAVHVVHTCKYEHLVNLITKMRKVGIFMYY